MTAIRLDPFVLGPTQRASALQREALPLVGACMKQRNRETDRERGRTTFIFLYLLVWANDILDIYCVVCGKGNENRTEQD